MTTVNAPQLIIEICPREPRASACRACAGSLPHMPRPVVMVSAETRLLICGQAPGRRVHESGIPFTDPSGLRTALLIGSTGEFDRRLSVYSPIVGPLAVSASRK